MSKELTQTQAIRNLQKYLRQLSFDNKTLPELPIDGVFDTETQRAVEIFQQEHRIPVTGIVDRTTWDAIYKSYLLSVEKNAKPNSVDIFFRSPQSSSLRMGDAGFAVSAIQYMLNEILTFYGNLPEITIDGYFGEQTADAVRLFQGYTSLPQNGEVNLETWNRISAVYNELFKDGNQ